MTEKISSSHLARRATVYLRQSTMKQVLEHRESTLRQYGLRERALALGWGSEQIDVVDDDLAQSATTTEARDGFQRLAQDVAHGRIGAIFSLEVARMARSSADWHQMLELCGLADVVIVDEQTVYTPRDYNDRLLLGLKGTMSEAELHARSSSPLDHGAPPRDSGFLGGAESGASAPMVVPFSPAPRLGLSGAGR